MWFWWGLASSLLGAASIVYNKHALQRVQPFVLTWSLFALSLPLLAILVLLSGPVSINRGFLFGVGGSAFAFILAKYWQLDAIQQDVLSAVIPLSAFSTFFAYILALFLLSESIAVTGIAGMVTIITGAYIFNITSRAEGIWQPLRMLFKNRTSRIYLIAMMLGALTAVFDKYALLSTQPVTPVLTLFSENVVSTIILSWVLVRRRPHYLHAVQTNVWSLTVASLIYAASVICIFYGFSTGPLALTISLRQMQVLFALGLGFLVFRDRPKRSVLLGTLLMLTGTVLVKLA